MLPRFKTAAVVIALAATAGIAAFAGTRDDAGMTTSPATRTEFTPPATPKKITCVSG